MQKVLWLASWYPNKIFSQSGDFIQRHARAVALYQPVYVIFVIKDEGLAGNDVYIEKKTAPNLEEVIAYYKPRKTGIKPLDRILSILKYVNVYKQLIRAFIEKEGRPVLVHVHVAMWAGVLGTWIKKKYQAPYIITEHWTGYEKADTESMFKKDILFRRQLRKTVKNASLFLPVSRQLGNTVCKNMAVVPYQVIPNVADTRYFNDSGISRERIQFIHVSGMTYQKNVEGILRSFHKAVAANQNIRLVMAGPAGKALKELSANLGLEQYVTWKGEISYTEVATEMKRSSALVMFSRYENLPCVIVEAQCCGLPVIATRVGGIGEVVNETNGILIESGDEDGLLKAMMEVINHYDRFDQKEIARTAMHHFSYEVVGQEIKQVYDSFSGRS